LNLVLLHSLLLFCRLRGESGHKRPSQTLNPDISHLPDLEGGRTITLDPGNWLAELVWPLARAGRPRKCSVMANRSDAGGRTGNNSATSPRYMNPSAPARRFKLNTVCWAFFFLGRSNPARANSTSPSWTASPEAPARPAICPYSGSQAGERPSSYPPPWVRKDSTLPSRPNRECAAPWPVSQYPRSRPPSQGNLSVELLSPVSDANRMSERHRPCGPHLHVKKWIAASTPSL